MVKDAGHFPHMEKPEIVNEAIWNGLEEKIPSWTYPGLHTLAVMAMVKQTCQAS